MKARIIVATLGIAALTATIALAQTPPESKKPGTKPPDKKAITPQDAQLPPSMTAEDMQACIEAATPGEMHAYLNEGVGVWKGKCKMWMSPEMEPTTSECVATNSPMMDGRFTKCEVAGEMPGMGPFNGFGIYGYDNVAQKFQSTWVDNMGTTMMVGTGDLSSDGTTLTWNYTYTCPITKKPTTMREIERRDGKNAYTLEMHGKDPKNGKEFKMMEIAFTRSGNAPIATPAATPAKPGTR
jgi:hypothetical protein